MQRPVTITVFGILNIVFGMFSIFRIVVMTMMFSLPQSTQNPVVKLIHDNPNYAAWMRIAILLAFVGGSALIASGIGLLRVKSWARKLSIAYAIYAILVGVLGIAMNYHFLVRPLLMEAQSKKGPEAVRLIGGAVGGTLGGCFGLVYPIVLFIFMMRPTVVAACRPLPEPLPL